MNSARKQSVGEVVEVEKENIYIFTLRLKFNIEIKLYGNDSSALN